MDGPFDVEYRADGEGGPALLACNGIGLSTFFWRPLADHFGIPPHQVVELGSRMDL